MPRLIDANALYEKACDLEAQALDYIVKIPGKTENWIMWNAILAERLAFKHDVNSAPTIKPEPQWIPTRDRKPTKAGQYLVTKQQKTGELQRATAHYNPTFDEWSGNGNFGKVLAWMELPPAYKEGAE